jgi:methyltransferase
LAQGAKEVGAGHYPLFFVLHVGWFVGWLAEAFWRGPILSDWWGLWLGLFAAAQLLRYWAISTLGPRWNTRILVIPGLAPIWHGPYRYVSHPNYIAVALELLVIPLIFNAWLTALLTTLLNATLLLLIRIPTEEKALTEA